MAEVTLQLAERDPRFTEHLTPELRYVIDAYSIPLADHVTDRLARALATAVGLIVPAVRELRPVTFVFGRPPTYAFHVGTGTHAYHADMSQDPIATAGHHNVFVDANRMAALDSEPYDMAVVCLLEELVHLWMNVRNEDVAQRATIMLHGGELVIIDGQYILDPYAASVRLAKQRYRDRADDPDTGVTSPETS